MKSRSYHNPLHLRLDNQIYWISASTWERKKIFSNSRKPIWVEVLKNLSKDPNRKLIAWVLLSNHYHLLIYLETEPGPSQFIKILHGTSSFLLNKEDRIRDRKVWYQYWDKCIRNEKDLYTRFNYIHNNPVKHSYVKSMDDYEYSSYNYYLNEFGSDWMQDVLESYPVIDFTPEELI